MGEFQGDRREQRARARRLFALCGLSARRRSAPFFKRFVLKTVSYSSKPYQICHCEEGAFFTLDAAIFDGTRRHFGTRHGKAVR